MTIDKTVPIPPKVNEAVYRGHSDRYSCRNCGYGFYAADWKYCPNCGQRILHYSYAGCMGWSKKAADTKWKEMQERG